MELVTWVGFGFEHSIATFGPLLLVTRLVLYSCMQIFEGVPIMIAYLHCPKLKGDLKYCLEHAMHPHFFTHQ
jgi:hypothetical protein